MMQAPAPDADEARDNAAFDALMWALARPGTLHILPNGLADLLLTLVDRECRVMTDDPALARLAAGNGAARIGSGQPLRLTGPGIETAQELHLAALPDGFFAMRAARCRYPEGVDIVFVDGQRRAGNLGQAGLRPWPAA